MTDKTPTIRRVGADEASSLVSPLQSYAFGSTPTSPRRQETGGGAASERDTAPDATPEAGDDKDKDNNVRLVAFDDGQPAAVVVGISMRQHVRGRTLPMVGVSGVATHPSARRRGHIRSLLTQLHGELRDEGHVVSTLYPYRMSFYERFGYVGFPKARRIRLYPDGLDRVLRADVPGEVTFHRIGEVFDEYHAYTERLLSERHGFSVFSHRSARWLGEADNQWVAFARHEGETVGALMYRTTGFGQELEGAQFLTRSVTGRALLLQWLARHAEQYASFTFELPPDERPDLWHVDVRYTDETKIASPTSSAPMGRVLSVEGLRGITAGPGQVGLHVVDDPFLGGTWTLDGSAGTLEVETGRTPSTGPVATLTSHGLAGLVYGVLDPEELGYLGYGTVDAEAARALRTLFPPAKPYLFAAF